MSKFVKRLSSYLTRVDNAVVLGSEFFALEDLLSDFQNVFVYDPDGCSVKRKNLIPKLRFDDTKLLPFINLIVVEEKYHCEIGNFIPMAHKNSTPIIVVSQDIPSKKINRALEKNHYELAETRDTLYIYRIKR